MENFNFDFSGKRVRLNGCALTKFDLAMAIDRFVHYLHLFYNVPVCFPLVTTIYPTEFNYSYYVERLKHYLSLIHA